MERLFRKSDYLVELKFTETMPKQKKNKLRKSVVCTLKQTILPPEKVKPTSPEACSMMSPRTTDKIKAFKNKVRESMKEENLTKERVLN